MQTPPAFVVPASGGEGYGSMSVIPIGGSPPPMRPNTARALPDSGFCVPDSAGLSTQSTLRAQAMVGANALSAMLGMQEIDPPQERDRRARRQGEKLLAALSRLQLALLSGADSGAITGELATLAADVPEPADPNLRDVLAGIRLRSAIEIERCNCAMLQNIHA